MISVDEALARVLALAPEVVAEEVPLEQAAGRVLAAPVRARLTQPPFDAAAMDGWAIRAADAPGPLRIVPGEAAAGRGHDAPLVPGEAIRIFTGAPVPAGANRVVMQEDAVREGETLLVPASGSAHIRLRGNDFSEGSEVFPRRRLGPAEVGLLAAMNLAAVPVARAPRVAIVPGGDELVPPGTVPGPGQIVSSNDLALAALVAREGGVPRRWPIVPDRAADLRAALEAAASEADVIVTIGGASVGEHDLVGRVTAAMGVEGSFWKVALRPGKPLSAGRRGRTVFLGLPGNPVSALVCGVLFLAPLLRVMQGLPGAVPTRPARLAVPLGPEGPRRHYLRAAWTEDGIAPFADQDSARQALMADADALVVRPAGDPARVPGETVEIVELR